MIFWGIFLSLAFLFPGCQKSGEKELGKRELVRINDVSISFEEFQQMLEKQPLEGKMRLVNEKGTRDFTEVHFFQCLLRASYNNVAAECCECTGA